MISEGRPGLPIDVLKLGVVSLLTDISSEMIFSVFAVFFTTIAGASAALLGLIEGLADLSASSLDYPAGWASDRYGRRKLLALAGYGFSTLSKTILVATTAVAGLAAFRVVERLGKSLRGPPRDAWLAAVAADQNRGFAYGVHKSLDKSGAVLGPLLAYGLLSRLGEHLSTYRTLFWIALVPAILGSGLLVLVPERPGIPHPRESPLATWKELNPRFKRYLTTAAVFSLGYFSFGFLLLRAYQVGFAIKDVILLYALSNLSFAATAPVSGRLGDLAGRGRLIVLGYSGYLLLCVGFALANSRGALIALFVLYGVFYAIDEAQSKAFIADLEPDRRASAIGLYNGVTGLIYLPASLVAGAFWTRQPAAAFLIAAGASGAAIMVFGMLRPDRGPQVPNPPL